MSEERRALDAFGIDNQVQQFMSECMEAGKTADDFQRRKSCTRFEFARELADVEIMVRQMILLVGTDAMAAARIEKREKMLAHIERKEAENRRKNHE